VSLEGVLTMRGERSTEVEGSGESGAHGVMRRNSVFVSRLQARWLHAGTSST